MTAGLPDIICCAEGMYIGLETKMPESRNNVSARQVYVHNQIYLAGGKVYVVCDPAEAVHSVKLALFNANGPR